MTTVNANIAAPRMLQVGGGAVRQIAEVLAKFGLSRPLVVTDPFMVSSRPRAALPGSARRRRHRRHGVQRHRARPDRHGDRGRRRRAASAATSTA